jgi:hypothetical protein
MRMTGVNMNNGSQHNAIINCEFYDISGSAIQIGDVFDYNEKDTSK